MPEHQTGVSSVSTRLRDAARQLREAEHLNPEARKQLARLGDNLVDALDSGAILSEEETNLAQSTVDVMKALHQRKSGGLLEEARDRLERAIVQAEVRAPIVTGLARQMIDALASIGI